MQQKIDFVVVDDKRKTTQELACPNCGEIFEIDAYTAENMVFDKEFMGFIAKCPDCGSVQI